VETPDGDGIMLMDEHYGSGFRLVLDGALTPPAAQGLTVIALGEGGIRETEGVVAAWMQRHRCHAALVRPDHYVYGAAATAEELSALIGEWQAALA
jgi:3-(3-hydroxy-phenyl)propionate hydroxylase